MTLFLCSTLSALNNVAFGVQRRYSAFLFAIPVTLLCLVRLAQGDFEALQKDSPLKCSQRLPYSIMGFKDCGKEGDGKRNGHSFSSVGTWALSSGTERSHNAEGERARGEGSWN